MTNRVIDRVKDRFTPPPPDEDFDVTVNELSKVITRHYHGRRLTKRVDLQVSLEVGLVAGFFHLHRYWPKRVRRSCERLGYSCDGIAAFVQEIRQAISDGGDIERGEADGAGVALKEKANEARLRREWTEMSPAAANAMDYWRSYWRTQA